MSDVTDQSPPAYDPSTPLRADATDEQIDARFWRTGLSVPKVAREFAAASVAEALAQRAGDAEPVTRERLAHWFGKRDCCGPYARTPEGPGCPCDNCYADADAILAEFPALGAAHLTNAEPVESLARCFAAWNQVGRSLGCAPNDDGQLIVSEVHRDAARRFLYRHPAPVASDPPTNAEPERLMVSETLLAHWQDVAWRKWAKRYDNAAYREAELSVALTTEQAMHAAWRKRAEEAERPVACDPRVDPLTEEEIDAAFGNRAWEIPSWYLSIYGKDAATVRAVVIARATTINGDRNV